jgi:hypothetical protein
MPEYREIEETLNVPKSVGMEGFLRTIREILKLPQVMSVNIDANGAVTYRRFVMENEPATVGIDFSDLEPWGVIRNGEVEELPVLSQSAAIVLGMMMDRASAEKMHPVAFVTGANSVFWEWFFDSTGHRITSREYVLGLPLHTDRHAPDTALILCAALTRDAALVDTRKSYKIEMNYLLGPNTVVEVFNE